MSATRCFMNDRNKFVKSAIPVFIWTLFALGAGQLVLVLTGPLLYLISNVFLAVLYILYLRKIERNHSFKKISSATMAAGLILLLLTLLYNYLVPLEVSSVSLLINIAGVGLYCITGLLMGLSTRPKYVTE
jgi:hypothetical protein